jgi:hypothetical protein
MEVCKMYDMGKDGGRICINSNVVPEIEDFKVGDIVELKVKARVIVVREVDEYDDIPMPEVEIDEETTKKEKKYIKSELELKECDIINIKEETKKAKELGMDSKDYKDIQEKRKKRVEESK